MMWVWWSFVDPLLPPPPPPRVERGVLARWAQLYKRGNMSWIQIAIHIFSQPFPSFFHFSFSEGQFYQPINDTAKAQAFGTKVAALFHQHLGYNKKLCCNLCTIAPLLFYSFGPFTPKLVPKKLSIFSTKAAREILVKLAPGVQILDISEIL